MGRPRKNSPLPNTKVEVGMPTVKRPKGSPARRSDGLRADIEYPYVDGKIDWFGLIDPKYWVPKREWFEKRNKEVPETAEGLGRDQIFVRLKGYLELLDLRGYRSLELIPVSASQEYVAVICKITFLPNLETDMEERIFSQQADAHFGNTNENGRQYLSAWAVNRAMSLAIRKFLGIEIASIEEMAPEPKTEDVKEKISDDLLKEIKELTTSLNWSFEELVSVINKNKEPTKQIDWSSWEDIPRSKYLSVVGALRKIQNKQKTR